MYPYHTTGRVSEFDPEDQVCYIGPQAFVIDHDLAPHQFMERARPIMRKLMETQVKLQTLGLKKKARFYSNQVETHESIRAFSAWHAVGYAFLGDWQGALAHMDLDCRQRITNDDTGELYKVHDYRCRCPKS